MILSPSKGLEISVVSSYIQDACIVSGCRELNRGKCDQGLLNAKEETERSSVLSWEGAV